MNFLDPKTLTFAQLVEMIGRLDLDLEMLSNYKQALMTQAAELSKIQAALQAASEAQAKAQEAVPTQGVSNEQIDWAEQVRKAVGE